MSQYITFVLRALGYQSGVDFQWDKAWELSDKLGITNGQYNSTTNFTRGDVVIVSYNALSINLKGKNTTLLDDLKARGVIKEQTTPNNPDIAEDGHTHNWATMHFDAYGYYQNTTGTHTVTFKKCNCGYQINSDQPNWYDTWEDHLFNCRRNYLNWTEEVPNGEPQWIEVVPEHDEIYCTICGATK